MIDLLNKLLKNEIMGMSLLIFNVCFTNSHAALMEIASGATVKCQSLPQGTEGDKHKFTCA